MRVLLILVFVLWCMTPTRVMGWEPGDLLQISAAFFTNLAVHESGHFIMGEAARAEENRLDFFSNQEGSFFLGLSSVGDIDKRSRLPYILGGPMASLASFEVALNQYRYFPTTFNQSMLFFSGTEFLWYSVYAFYLSPSRDNRHDPVAFSHETGLSPETILVIAMTQSILNGYRVFSGQDWIVPYFTFDLYSTSLLVGIRF